MKGDREEEKGRERDGYFVLQFSLCLGFPGGSVVKNLPAIAGDMDLSLGLGRSPGEATEMATHSSTLAWKIP